MQCFARPCGEAGNLRKQVVCAFESFNGLDMFRGILVDSEMKVGSSLLPKR
jgi:hypothetical protein